MTVKLGNQPEIGISQPQNIGPDIDIQSLNLSQSNAIVEAEKKVIEMNRDSTFPTVIVDLPSRGLFYPPDNPLSSGKIEMKYMTAKEEDILTTKSYIDSGVVFDKLYQSLIVTPVDYNTILNGDKDAIMFAARIYGYGENYKISVQAPSGEMVEQIIDLREVPAKEIDESLIIPGRNEFNFILPISGKQLVVKLFTVADSKQVDEKLKKYRKVGSADPMITSRLIQQIVSIDGNTDKRYIETFVMNELRVSDSIALRKFIGSIQPGLDLKVELEDPATGDRFLGEFSPGFDFFWPE